MIIPKFISVLTTNFLLQPRSWTQIRHTTVAIKDMTSTSSLSMIKNPPLSESDDEAFQILKSEQNRQIGGIELIARYVTAVSKN